MPNVRVYHGKETNECRQANDVSFASVNLRHQNLFGWGAKEAGSGFLFCERPGKARAQQRALAKRAESANFTRFAVSSSVIDRSRMSSTSQKHRDFVAEPMGDKDVTALPGVGKTIGARLADKGFDKAYVVLGQFLVLKKNEELFLDWINTTAGANAKYGGDCYAGLRDWCNSFL